MQNIKEPIERNSIKKKQKYQDKSGIRRGNSS